jgi:hypothetical protein
MKEPTPGDFEAYHRVKRYLNDQAAQRVGGLRRNDSLFAPGELAVLVGGMGTFDSWERYQEGYYDAARLCIQNMGEGGIDQARMVYPILFLYRHYLELMLKSILMEAAATFRRPLQAGTAHEHNLLKLWDGLRSMIELERKRPMLRGTDRARRILAQFNEIDPESMETRYGLRKDFSTPSLPKQREISLRNLQSIMGKIHKELNQLLVNFQCAYEAFFAEYPEVDLE